MKHDTIIYQYRDGHVLVPVFIVFGSIIVVLSGLGIPIWLLKLEAVLEGVGGVSFVDVVVTRIVQLLWIIMGLGFILAAPSAKLTIVIFSKGHGIVIQGTKRLLLPQDRAGFSTDFTFTFVFGTIVVSPRVRDIVESVDPDRHQFIDAVTSKGRECFILNILDMVDCLDERAILRRLDDGRAMMNWPIIRAMAADGHHLFRLQIAPSRVICSEKMVEAFELARLTGVDCASADGTWPPVSRYCGSVGGTED